jgi:hypothetical protein
VIHSQLHSSLLDYAWPFSVWRCARTQAASSNSTASFLPSDGQLLSVHLSLSISSDSISIGFSSGATRVNNWISAVLKNFPRVTPSRLQNRRSQRSSQSSTLKFLNTVLRSLSIQQIIRLPCRNSSGTSDSIRVMDHAFTVARISTEPHRLTDPVTQRRNPLNPANSAFSRIRLTRFTMKPC